jgi:hypothetical protein
MAYDPVSKQLLLFSGSRSGGAPADDTWIWNGVSWHDARPATNPPPRTDAAVAFDPVLKEIVMFGGWIPVSGGTSGMRDDTWAWDGTDWTELHPAAVPSARAESVMAYDAVSHMLLMFGGIATDTTNETWLFNGRTWTQVHFPKGAPQPAARDATQMAADGANHTVVLFGGEEVDGMQSVAAANDTWTWDGSAWMQVHPLHVPPARGVEEDSGMMTYDTKLGVVVLYGGPINNPQEALGDTWTWNGTTWTEVANNGPVPRQRQGC